MYRRGGKPATNRLSYGTALKIKDITFVTYVNIKSEYINVWNLHDFLSTMYDLYFGRGRF
jgi:hypothetical protein